VVNFSGFLQVKNYLKKLPAIKAHTLVATYADSLLFEVEYLSNEEHLLQTLNLGNVLQKVEASLNESSSEQLEYTPVILDTPDNDKNDIQNPESAYKEESHNQEVNKLNSNTPDSKPADVSTQTLPTQIKQNQEEFDSGMTETQGTLPQPDVEYWLIN